MSLPNIFSAPIADAVIARIEKLMPNTNPQWGKMSAAQMLAHCNVIYEMSLEDIHKKPNVIVKFILTLMVKNSVVSEKPYKHNSQTAPQLVIKEDKNFEEEKRRLIQYIQKVQTLGDKYFDMKESHSFGALSSSEWNNLYYKHLDHHLGQFGL
jgi:hypothetical protein